MRRVFADSAFWIARRDMDDPRHDLAAEIAQWLVLHRYTIVATPFIFAETHAYFSRNSELKEFIIDDFWENPSVQIDQPTHRDQMDAIALLRRFPDKTYPFADAVSFVVMKRLQIDQVVTFDRHFRQFGEFAVIDHIPA